MKSKSSVTPIKVFYKGDTAELPGSIVPTDAFARRLNTDLSCYSTFLGLSESDPFSSCPISDYLSALIPMHDSSEAAGVPTFKSVRILNETKAGQFIPAGSGYRQKSFGFKDYKSWFEVDKYEAGITVQSILIRSCYYVKMNKTFPDMGIKEGTSLLGASKTLTGDLSAVNSTLATTDAHTAYYLIANGLKNMVFKGSTDLLESIKHLRHVVKYPRQQFINECISYGFFPLEVRQLITNYNEVAQSLVSDNKEYVVMVGGISLGQINKVIKRDALKRIHYYLEDENDPHKAIDHGIYSYKCPPNSQIPKVLIPFFYAQTGGKIQLIKSLDGLIDIEQVTFKSDRLPKGIEPNFNVLSKSMPNVGAYYSNLQSLELMLAAKSIDIIVQPRAIWVTLGKDPIFYRVYKKKGKEVWDQMYDTQRVHDLVPQTTYSQDLFLMQENSVPKRYYTREPKWQTLARDVANTLVKWMLECASDGKNLSNDDYYMRWSGQMKPIVRMDYTSSYYPSDYQSISFRLTNDMVLALAREINVEAEQLNKLKVFLQKPDWLPSYASKCLSSEWSLLFRSALEVYADLTFAQFIQKEVSSKLKSLANLNRSIHFKLQSISFNSREKPRINYCAELINEDWTLFLLIRQGDKPLDSKVIHQQLKTKDGNYFNLDQYIRNQITTIDGKAVYPYGVIANMKEFHREVCNKILSFYTKVFI